MSLWQNEDERRPEHVVLLTALPLEAREVRSHLVGAELHTHEAGTIFEVGSLPGVRQKIVLAVTGEGNNSAAVLAERAIAAYRPCALLLVGVAGALKDDVALGDVVVATHVHYYEGGKDTAEQFRSYPRSWEASPRLVQRAKWIDPAEVAWPGETPAVHFKPIASGEVVLGTRTSALAQLLRERFGDAAAIEMAFAVKLVTEYTRAIELSAPTRRGRRAGALGHPVLEARLDGAVTGLCFGPGNTLLASAITGPIRRWSLSGGEELPSLAAARGTWPHSGVRVAASAVGGPVVVRDGNRLVAVYPDEPDRPPVPLASVTVGRRTAAREYRPSPHNAPP